MSLVDDLLKLYGDERMDTISLRSSTDLSALELQDIYKERFPYTGTKTIVGDRFIWDENFINKVLYAMSTDDLSDFSQTELDVWYGFVSFEDYHSNLANDTVDKNAIGCTIPDDDGNSYIVTNDGITDKLCSPPIYGVPQAVIYASLDKALVSIYNCIDYNNTDIKEGELVDIQPCNLNKGIIWL